MSGIRRAGILLAAIAAVAASVAVATPAAAAPTLAGAWAPLNRCPVDDPAMLAADGTTVVAQCMSASVPSITFAIGDTVLTSGQADVQLGMLNQGLNYTLVAPQDGAFVTQPIEIPGGLLGIMCPSNIPLVSMICMGIVNSPLNRVTVSIVSVGAPTDFNLAAGLGVGQPILTMRLKVKLDNPFLGSNCYIGSDTDPIVLKPANLARPTGSLVRFNADGSPNPTGEMGYVSLTGEGLGDSTFVVPRSNGCGLFGILSSAVDAQQGLPSPAGSNSLTLNNTVMKFGGFQFPRNFTPTEGQQLSNRWHAAVVG